MSKSNVSHDGATSYELFATLITIHNKWSENAEGSVSPQVPEGTIINEQSGFSLNRTKKSNPVSITDIEDSCQY